ncbi:MAG: hypothetical protein NUV97_01850 [archaeon]|nr:hypothetical protein [archaeon]MCR4323697.1 hypothetical protein [Nanoarchaeota archaeon]
MKEKGGAAHFEMIISFIFFISFVLFLFLVIKPYGTTKLSDAVINGMHDTFKENTQTNLTNIFLRADSSVAGGCFYINLPQNILEYDPTSSIVTKVSGTKINSSINPGNSLNVNDNGSSNFFKIAISPIFSQDTLSSCEELTAYTFGGILEKQIISYPSLQTTETQYYSNYETLRSSLKLPSIYDFSIVAEEIGIFMERETPDVGDILARDYMEEVMYGNGTIINMGFTIKIW